MAKRKMAKSNFKDKYLNWKKEIKKVIKPLIISIIVFAFASLVTLWAARYTTRIDTVYSPDLVLDNLPVQDWGFLFFIWPIVVISVGLLYSLIVEPKKSYYFIYMASFLYLIRALFIVLTHLSTPYDAIDIPLYFENDVFFSGHTALPFLCFLMFKRVWAKAFMLFSTFLMGFVVLITHRHYSIDVAAALFITYAVYKLGNNIFYKISAERK